MFRKLAVAFALAAAALVLSMGTSSAAVVGSSDYPPPSVLATSQSSATSLSTTATSSVTNPASTSTQVLGTNQDVAGNLSYTGSGIDVGLFIGIGAIVLLLGIGLTVVGTRMSRSRSAHHS